MDRVSQMEKVQTEALSIFTKKKQRLWRFFCKIRDSRCIS